MLTWTKTTLTAKSLAEMLDGNFYGAEITPALALEARECGLVVVYGYSDDCIEFEGAIYDEFGGADSKALYFNADGLMYPPDCAANEGACPYYDAAIKTAKKIVARWNAEKPPCWTYETDIPHETFNIYEDDYVYCRGIVFSVADLEG